MRAYVLSKSSQFTFPLLTTSCNLELIDSEVLAALDFLTGAILLDTTLTFLEVMKVEGGRKSINSSEQSHD
jgi:hypothetical protein